MADIWIIGHEQLLRGVAVLVLASFVVACTTTRTVDLDTPSALTKEVHPGDRVAITTRDGQELTFQVVRVEGEALVGATERVQRDEIAQLEVTRFSPLRTAGTAGGGALLAVMIAGFCVPRCRTGYDFGRDAMSIVGQAHVAARMAIPGAIMGLRRVTHLSAGLVLGLVAAGLSATAQEAAPSVAYEDPAAVGRRDRAIGILTWAEPITVIAIDGAAVDPVATERRARLAPGVHVVYFFGTAPAIGDCPPVTGDDLVELHVEEGRSYSITAKGPEDMAEFNEQYPDVCPIDLEVSSAGGRIAGPFPSLWAAERLARQRQAATNRLNFEWQRLARAAADGDPDAAVDLALWYFLGDAPLSSPDPVAAQAWLIAAAERGALSAEEMRRSIEPTLSAAQRSAAEALAGNPPLPALEAGGVAR